MRLGQGLAQCGQVAGKAKKRRRARQPRQMPLDARGLRGPHGGEGFDQTEARIVRGDEAQLVPTFLPLGGGVGVDHHAAAHAQLKSAGSGSLPCGLHAIFDLQGANGHAEHRQRPLPSVARVNEAQRTGIKPARPALQRADDLHAFALGRARHRAAGKQRGKNLRPAPWPAALVEHGLHAGGHLPHSGIALDAEALGHAHRTRHGQPPQIVAQQVEDHQVLGAVLGIGSQRQRGLRVGFCVGAARSGALHRPCAQRGPVTREKQFGRKTEHPAPAEFGQAGITRGLRLPQRGIQRQRMAERLPAQRPGEVDLVAVARAQVRSDARQGGGVVRLRDAGLQSGHAAGLATIEAGALRLEPLLRLGGGHAHDRIERQRLDQRGGQGSMHGQASQRLRGFVMDEQGDLTPSVQCVFELLKSTLDLLCLPRLPVRQRLPVQASQRLRRLQRVVEQHKVLHGGEANSGKPL